MRFRKTVAVQHQTYQHLLAIGPLIPRVATLGLRITLSLAFEVSRGQIIQVQSVVEMKQRLLAFGQLRFDALAVRVQPVQVAVQSIVVQRGKIHAQDVGQRRTPHPIRHGMLGQRKDQTVQGHRFTQQAGSV